MDHQDLILERDPAYWLAVATHPEVAPRVLKDCSAQQLAELVMSPLVKPYRAPGGGFLWRNLDGFGAVLELHTLFLPEAWGRPVAMAARAVTERVFAEGAQLLVTSEQEDWWRSRPPKSHGWRPCGVFQDTPAGRLRLWRLSLNDWRASPVGA